MTAQGRPLVELRDLTKRFAASPAVDQISLEIRRGEIHALIGANGAGKSTLVKMLAGDIRPSDGQIIYKAAPVSFANPQEALAAGIATIYQDLVVAPDLTVAENVVLGHEPARRHLPGSISRARAASTAAAALARLGADISTSALVGSLSFPERQLVAIARALAAERDLLILDEPTASLTSDTAEHLHRVIRTLRDDGHAVLYISHRLDEVRALADRVTVLRDARCVATVRPGEVAPSELIRLMLGEAREQAASAPGSPESAAPMLDVRAISRAPAFHEVSFSVRRGEILGIAGVPGSGRGALVNALVGTEALDAGEIRINGHPCRMRSPRHALEQGMMLLPGDRARNGLALDQSVKTNLVLSPGGEAAWRGLRLHRRERAVAESLAGRVGVRPKDPDRFVGQLSGGNQQRVLVARALYKKPTVLILDEPTQGVDVGGKAEIHELIRQFAQHGTAVIVSSSEFEELETVCDRIAVLRLGKIVGRVEPEQYGGERLLELALPA